MRVHNNHKKRITAYFQNTVEMEKIVFKKKYSVVVATFFFLLFNFRASSMRLFGSTTRVTRVNLTRGGTRSENWWGCAAGRWKLDPKRSREKWNLGPKRSNSLRIGSFNTPKDRFGVGGWEKIPQKDRARSCQSEKRGSKPRHICITHHIVSTPHGTWPTCATSTTLPCRPNASCYRPTRATCFIRDTLVFVRVPSDVSSFVLTAISNEKRELSYTTPDAAKSTPEAATLATLVLPINRRVTRVV